MGSKIVKFFSTSLQRRLMLLLVTVTVVVMMAAGGYGVTVQARSASVELHNKADQMSLLLERSLAIPLWNLNLDLVEEQLAAVMADPEVSSVAIYERGVEEPLLLKQREEAEFDEDSIERTTGIVYKLEGENILLGQLRLVYTQRYLQSNIKRLQLMMVGIVLLLSITLLAGTYLVIEQTVEKPMKKIVSMLGRVTAGDLNQTVDIQRDDEIGILAQSLNTMTAQLRELYSGLEQQVAERTRDLEHRAVQLQAAAEVARDAASVLDIEELMNVTVERISEHFGFYHAGIFLVDDAREYVVLRAASSARGERTVARGFQLKIGAQGIVGYTAQSGQPHIVPDVKREPFYFAHPDLPETRSEMTLPLRVRGETVGVLDAQSTEPDAFNDEDVDTLQTMADQLAVAIENARLFEQTQASLREVRSLYRGYSKEAWGELTRAGRFHGYTYDRVSVFPVTADRPLEVQQVLREGHIVTVGGGDDGGSESVLAVPVSVRGEAIGVLDIRKSGESGEWTPEELLLVKRVSDQLSLALENARLLEDSQHRAAREQLVGRMTARFTRSLDMEAVLRTAVRELGQLPQVAEVSVHVISSEASPAASEGEEA